VLLLLRRLLDIPLRSEIAALAHVPRPLAEQLTPVELRTLVDHAKQLANKTATHAACLSATQRESAANK